MAKKRSKKTKKSSDSSGSLTSPEKLQALSELGLSPSDLRPRKPTWSYVLGALMVVGAFGIASKKLRG